MLKYITLALAAACMILGMHTSRQTATIAAREATITQQAAALVAAAAKSQRDARAGAKRMAAAQATARHDKEATHAKDQALTDAPEWADQPLPAGVAEWLRNQHSNGVPP